MNYESTFEVSRLTELLDSAENSLEELFASDDEKDVQTLTSGTPKFNSLRTEYARLREFIGTSRQPHPDGRWPNARDLFWDDPVTDKEDRCLSDAMLLFAYLRKLPKNE
jgi:hypothetical protein